MGHMGNDAHRGQRGTGGMRCKVYGHVGNGAQ